MKKVFKIQNLKCKGCESSILKNLLTIDGVKNMSLNIPNNELILEVDNELAFDEVRLKLSKIGYPIVGDGNTFANKVTSYVSCAIGKIKNAK